MLGFIYVTACNTRGDHSDSGLSVGGAGHRTIPIQELQDGLRGADQSATGGPSSSASQHGLLP